MLWEYSWLLEQDFLKWRKLVIQNWYYVRKALKSVSLGHTDKYNQIKSCMFSNSNKVLTLEEVALQVTILKALSGAVSYIDNVQHESLLSVIFQMILRDHKSPDVIDALVELVVSLASSSKLVDSCLEMLVSHFKPLNKFLELLRSQVELQEKAAFFFVCIQQLKTLPI